MQAKGNGGLGRCQHISENRNCRACYHPKKETTKPLLQFKSPMAKVIEANARFTLMDQIGLLGGTIGLFTGLSLVSLVEAAFWIYRLARGLIVKLAVAGKAKERSENEHNGNGEEKDKGENESTALDQEAAAHGE